MLVGSSPRRVAVIGGARIPFARAHGAYASVGNQEMLTASLKAVVDRYSLRGQRLGDVVAGAVMKHSSQWNLTRESLLDSGLSPETPGLDVQRACGTSIEAAIVVANKIALGQIDAGIAGGVDTVSDPPIVFGREYRQLMLRSFRARSFGERIAPFLGFRPRHFKPHFPGTGEPRTGLSMGQHTEKMAREWQIAREDQDAFALQSHQHAHKAWSEGFMADLVVPYLGLKFDNNVRGDTSMEKLAKLKPSFAKDGTLTAGNSTPMTDGSAAVLLASEEWAGSRGLTVQAYMTHAKVAAVDFVGGEGLLMAPAYAVPRMLADAGLRFRISISTRSTRPLPRKCSARSRPGNPRSSAASGSASQRRSARSTARSSTSRGAVSQSAILSQQPAHASLRRWQSSSRSEARAAG